ncbi:MAG TPA: YwiC-like family protein [Anaerolineales bacterium]|nr:YwiC-like family protein [Anaerolineales bacterium]
MTRKDIFKKHIAIPQDHGSWVFILSPLLIGVFAGRSFTYATFNLIVAAMAAFMLRQPATALIKILSKRRGKTNLRAVVFWMSTYGLIALLALTALVLEGFGFVIYLAVPGISVFAWHLWLVSKREERRQVNVEIIATGVLSLSAPAAYWVGIGEYDPYGWWLWALVWFQTAASIVYAYLRLSQREQAKGPDRSGQWKMGWRAALYTTFNLASVLTLGLLAVLPRLLFIPYLVQWLETMWGITHPAVGWKPTRIGVRQLIVSTIWTVLFIIFWR